MSIRDIRIGFILLALFFISGCAQTVMPERAVLGSTGQYGELVKYEEGKTGTLEKANTEQLYNLCYSYSKTKNYKKLFECTDQMEKRIAQGDKQIFLLSSQQSGFGNGNGNGKDKWIKGGLLGGLLATGHTDGSAYPSLFRAEALVEMGDYARAVVDAKKAVDLCMSVRPSSFVGVEHLECSISALGLFGLASALNKDTTAAKKAIEGLNKLQLGFVSIATTSPKRQMAVARIYITLGEYEAALGYMNDSFGSLRSMASALMGGFSKSGNIFADFELPYQYIRAKCQLETGRLKDAKAGLDSLLEYPQVKDNGEIYWMLMYDRGRIAEKEGDLKGATDHYRKAVDVIEMQRSTINTETSKIGFVGDKQAVYRSLVSVLFREGQYGAAFEYVERSKSRALVDMLAAKQDFAVNNGDPEKVKNLLAMANDAESKAMLQWGDGDKSQTRSLVVNARQQLSTESPDLSSLVNVSALAASEIEKLVPQDESLVEYYYNAPDFLAFILSAKGLDAVRLDGTGLQDSVRQFRQEIENPGSQAYMKLSRQLYDQLFRPVAGQVGTQKLIIVAHGPLHYLPFNALNDGQNYLIDRYSLRMLPSASVLKYLRAEAVNKPGNILAFGNPDLGNPAYDLAHAQEEAIAVTKGKAQSKVLLRKAASETAFRKYGEEFRYLHFATHGQFNADAPLKSALLLSGDGQNDGMLTVDKLYSLKLDADLVTLSACETGLGKIANGDDVVGLTRGFLYAGSRTIVASLWQVDDLATSYLMTHFYADLQQGDKREALRQAQLDTRVKYPHPYYWAAFQLTGRAR